MSDVITFKPPDNAGEPKLTSVRGRDNRTMQNAYCAHRAKLIINEDTQLVECVACHLVMSAYAALMVISKEWKNMHYDTTEWKRMHAETEKNRKESAVRRAIRQLQWIEIPEESEPEARRYWERLTEAYGEPPYAMFRRGRGKRRIQYCVLSKSGGWTDADFMLNHRPTLVKSEKATR